MKLFFLQRETNSKENAKNINHEHGNSYKFRSYKVRVTHSRSIG